MSKKNKVKAEKAKGSFIIADGEGNISYNEENDNFAIETFSSFEGAEKASKKLAADMPGRQCDIYELVAFTCVPTGDVMTVLKTKG